MNKLISIVFSVVAAALVSGCAGLPRYYKADAAGPKQDQDQSYFQIRIVNNAGVPLEVFENATAGQGPVSLVQPGDAETIQVRSNYAEPWILCTIHARIAGAAGTTNSAVITRQFSFDNYRWSIYGGSGFGEPRPQVHVWDLRDYDFRRY